MSKQLGEKGPNIFTPGLKQIPAAALQIFGKLGEIGLIRGNGQGRQTLLNLQVVAKSPNHPLICAIHAFSMLLRPKPGNNNDGSGERVFDTVLPNESKFPV